MHTKRMFSPQLNMPWSLYQAEMIKRDHERVCSKFLKPDLNRAVVVNARIHLMVACCKASQIDLC